ncbi:methionine adenosyltransferase [Corynebacterium minutissimum]|uniref:S-adenosylmethionine synthase n=1 Tax=Corynebacterium minutissimum TaxID=38301 RepID=A0A2X4RCS3_9CORY|nr:methionine adenosyltransferase [Corynebacterium minutissimum]KHO29414.1 S-adenosylmethionine synthetase [Corynebacterium minutissimum]MCG7229059.1 methionine adenosyltransferase [Corynebacterium minutissimum]MCG7238176.1 methionine adenosyltransferase [Corynebacterium minutissimum]QPS58834.1 methionine adenosyltransferase [Corynebacterium minutissimum]QQA80376.1 methionine adenosyltransferase [Corynebacterium minutissimum]
MTESATQAVRLFTSESVTEGHPDKICDAISDAILDALLEVDPDAHVAVETMVTTGQVHVVGEVRTSGYVEIPQIVRKTLVDIGFTSSDVGFDGHTCGVNVAIGEQSQEIGAGVDASTEVRSGDYEDDDQYGAGDQGLMFGYATNETPEFMPLPISTAHHLSRRLTQVRKEGIVPSLRPDGKTQVTFAYDEDDVPTRLETIVISTQHDPDVTQEWLAEQLRTHVVEWVVDDAELGKYYTDETELLINPSGSFILGGPMGDAGLTGRKIIVDTYGGMARHGGGAFSGKDPSKVDRSAAYAMRWVAKNIVAAGLADRAEVQVAYAIGRAKPVGLYVETFGTAKEGLTDGAIQAAVNKVFDLRPAAIIRDLDLQRPLYSKTAAYGHFGRTDVDLPWEDTSRAEDLRRAAGL